MSLSVAANNSFPDISPLLQEFHAGLERLKDLDPSNQLGEIRQFSARFYAGENKLEGLDLHEACKTLIDWHVQKLEDSSFSSAENVLISLNRTLANIGCRPVHDVGYGEHYDDKLQMRDVLLNRALHEIEIAKSGCLVDMAIKNFTRGMNQIGLPIGADARDELKQANYKRTVEGMKSSRDYPVGRDMWRDWGKSIRHTLTRYETVRTPSISPRIPVLSAS